MEREYFYAEDLEDITGIKSATWRYWASVGQGPPSFLIGRRRVWRKTVVREWLEAQEGRTKRVPGITEIAV